MLHVKILIDTDLHTFYNVYMKPLVFIYSLRHQALNHGTGTNQQYVRLSCIQVSKCLLVKSGVGGSFCNPHNLAFILVSSSAVATNLQRMSKNWLEHPVTWLR